MAERILVTGGAGFIGSNLVRRLLDTSTADVVVLDDYSTGYAANLSELAATHSSRLAIHEGSVVDSVAVERAADGATSIVHLAALGSVPRSVAHPLTTHEVNVTGTLRVLDVARRTGLHTVLAGSSSVYGSNPTLPKREDLATLPRSPYAASKLAAEAYTLGFAASYGLPVLAFRFFNVFGPHQRAGHAYAAVIPQFVDAALAGRPLTVHGDGRQSRDFTFVDTVTWVLADAALRKVSADQPVNLALGTQITLVEVIDQLREILGRSLDVEHVESRPGDVAHSRADSSRLISLFGEVPTTPFADALARTVDWMRSLTREPTGRG